MMELFNHHSDEDSIISLSKTSSSVILDDGGFSSFSHPEALTKPLF